MTDLATAVDRLVRQVGHWTPSRWAASGAGPALHALIQRLADLDADAEGHPHRRVPRLANDLAFPDQLRVISTDLIAAAPAPAVLAEATAAVESASRRLPGAPPAA